MSLPSVTLTLVPAGCTVPFPGDEDLTTERPGGRRGLTLPILQWAPISALLAAFSDLPASLGTLHLSTSPEPGLGPGGVVVVLAGELPPPVMVAGVGEGSDGGGGGGRSAAATTRSAWMNPEPQSVSGTPGAEAQSSELAGSVSRPYSWSTDSVGFADSASAATPATLGAAALVP